MAAKAGAADQETIAARGADDWVSCCVIFIEECSAIIGYKDWYKVSPNGFDMKLPAFQFYPGDWMKDPALRRCTAAARGAWIDTLCLMFECETHGILRTNHVPWTKEQLARTVGVKMSIIEELILGGVMRVAKRTQTLWSKRMLKDERIRRVRALAGSKGGSKHASKPQAKLKQTPKRNTPPSSSSSSSTSEKGVNPLIPPALDVPEFVEAWERWLKHLREKRKPPTITAMEGQLSECEAWGLDRAIAALKHSTAKSYQGIYEAKGNDNGNRNLEKPARTESSFDRVEPIPIIGRVGKPSVGGVGAEAPGAAHG